MRCIRYGVRRMLKSSAESEGGNSHLVFVAGKRLRISNAGNQDVRVRLGCSPSSPEKEVPVGHAY
jgi:hypothetical protein